MKKTTFFNEDNAVWLKGNLHAHSTNSDGRLTPEQLAKAYKERGYAFLAVTDHDVFKSYPELCNEDFLVLPAMELTGPLTETKNSHLGVIQKADICDFEDGEKFQLKTRQDTLDFIEKYHDHNLIILNHPYWSLLEWEEVIDVPHLTCMEIYNTGCEVFCGVGENSHFFNTMLRKEKSIWAVAADDCHNRGEQAPGWPFDFAYCDSCGGWVCVKAKSFTREGIIEALEQGSFYASTGPEIYDFYVEDDRFYLKCSPCTSIVLSGDWGYFQRELGENITEFSGKLRGKEKFIRVQCTDAQGKKAYTNPIYIK